MRPHNHDGIGGEERYVSSLRPPSPRFWGGRYVLTPVVSGAGFRTRRACSDENYLAVSGTSRGDGSAPQGGSVLIRHPSRTRAVALGSPATMVADVCNVAKP